MFPGGFSISFGAQACSFCCVILPRTTPAPYPQSRNLEPGLHCLPLALVSCGCSCGLFQEFDHPTPTSIPGLHLCPFLAPRMVTCGGGGVSPFSVLQSSHFSKTKTGHIIVLPSPSNPTAYRASLDSPPPVICWPLGSPLAPAWDFISTSLHMKSVSLARLACHVSICWRPLWQASLSLPEPEQSISSVA